MIAIIDFTKKSKEFALTQKEILLFVEGELIDRRPYSLAELNSLLKEGWFVYDRTYRKEISEESVLVPDVILALGRLQLHRWGDL
ncbi:MAG TPA: hypothetical protein ENF58_02105 [Candidatus Altiarchaeales archaeon]|nr:hypothetical protein [Candidatus Altiarchaeales archaeon]